MPRPFARSLSMGGSLLAGFAFVVPLTAAFAHPDVGWTIRALIVLLVVASAMRPAIGLGALILILPLATPLATGGVSGAALADACLLAFVAGASWRLAAPDPAFPDRLGAPAAVLIAAIASSTVVELFQARAIVPREPFWPDVWHHVTGEFWVDTQSFAVLHHAVRWVAGLAAAVYVERLLRRAPDRAGWILGLWLGSGALAGVLTVATLVGLARASGGPFVPGFVALVSNVRLSALQPDLNAAGSYFALFLAPALVLGLEGRVRWVLVGVLPAVLAAFWLARSRAALAAVVLVLSLHLLRRVLSSRDVRRMAVAGVVVAAIVAATAVFALTSRSHVSLGAAAEVRLQLTEVGLRTAARFPVFGVGLGDYIRITRREIDLDMIILRQFAPDGENAHNNYLQILVELGVPACLVFVWLVWSPVVAALAGAGGAASGPAYGLALGLAAFLLSAFFGHPLLVPRVFAPFFLAVGLTAGLGGAPGDAWRQWSALAWAGVGFYLVSLMTRLAG